MSNQLRWEHIPDDENGKLLAKVPDSAQYFLARAREDIDQALGEGYAAAHPQLVMIHVLACAHAGHDFVEMLLKSGIKL